MVLTHAGGITFLIYDGVRAPIDPTDPVLVSALHLDDGEVREVSPGLLNAFPLVGPIAPVVIPGVGEPVGYLEQKYRVGAIVTAVDSRGEQLYVVLRDGLQPISAATADIIRYGDSDSPSVGAPASISPALVSEAPHVDDLRVDHYPKASPRFITTEPDRVICLSWERGNSDAAATNRLLVGHALPVPAEAKPVPLATADGNGPALDGVYLKPGTGEYVQATGDQPDSRAMGQLFYVSDTGVRFHVKDLPTAAALGVTGVKPPGGGNADVPQLAPWPVISLLPAGPALSQQAALIAHDGMAADPDGFVVKPPKA
jgi:type VII secretion protein EccB